LSDEIDSSETNFTKSKSNKTSKKSNKTTKAKKVKAKLAETGVDPDDLPDVVDLQHKFIDGY
jgi:hypothetical protein